MTLIRRLRLWLARLILRGDLGRRWTLRKIQKLENHYLHALVVSSAHPLPQPKPAPAAPKPAIRRLLVIADFMWEKVSLIPELEKICPVSTLDLNPALRENRDQILPSDVVLRTVDKFLADQPGLQPDAILFYARPSLLSDDVFARLRQRWSVPLIGMNLDDKVEFLDFQIFYHGNHNYQRWARKFDLNICSSLAVLDWYRQAGLPCIYAPGGAYQPPGLAIPASTDFAHQLSFVGSCKPERQVVIEQLQSAGVPVKLFGSGWPGGTWVDDPVQVFRASQMNLGIGLASPSLVLTNLKARDFECPGVGGCYLTTYNWELAAHYDIGREILCYRSVEELIEIFSYYRHRPDECLRIAQAGWRRCANEHTWEQRFRAVLRQRNIFSLAARISAGTPFV